jgi:hypothetical protein
MASFCERDDEALDSVIKRGICISAEYELLNEDLASLSEWRFLRETAVCEDAKKKSYSLCV